MKYYIKLHWWRQCHARPGRSACLTIEGDPAAYLRRQEARLGDDWTDMQIDFACPVGDDAVVSPDPDLGHRSKRWDEYTPEEQAAQNRQVTRFLAAFALIIVVGGVLLYAL